ncbi:MAG: type IV pilus modification protein PilV [Gammaproteobacteria bacterium]|nr:type IV pilus modification protein PilV [Gammaproteobacteria bacterium]
MPRRRFQQSGFSLIEVLVAVLIVSVGVLGVAGLQLLSLQNNTSAMFRTQAIQSAYDIMDRARANRDIVYAIGMEDNPPQNPPNCETTICSPQQMRNFDIAEWRADLADTLPNGTGAIAYTGGVMTVTVRWQDTRNPAAAPLEVAVTTQINVL